ncbi:MAG TPA: ParA family protein [Aeromonadales bacterium]|nr:ParA family protein [Aeromonadales bacterium]
MQVWTIANQKGGVGKTTTAVNLGGLLAEQGNSVLLIDLDPHTSLTAYFDIDSDSLSHTIFECFKNTDWSGDYIYDNAVLPTLTKNLQIIPGSIAMATIDRQINNLEGKGFLLTNTLKKLSSKFDYVLIDCPPMLGILMVNALAICDRLLVPCQTEYLALKGLERMLDTVAMIAKAGRSHFSFSIVPTMFDRRTNASMKALRTMRDRYPESLWNNVIPVDTKFRDASQLHKPLSEVDAETHGLRGYKILLRQILADKIQARSAA